MQDKINDILTKEKGRKKAAGCITAGLFGTNIPNISLILFQRTRIIAPVEPVLFGSGLIGISLVRSGDRMNSGGYCFENFPGKGTPG